MSNLANTLKNSTEYMIVLGDFNPSVGKIEKYEEEIKGTFFGEIKKNPSGNA